MGRYVVFEAFARGGMATVHLGRLSADRGFSRLVAIKMLARDHSGSSVYARALEEEARIASRIRHPNVVQPLDFVVDGEDLFVVMEYVHGVALSQLLAASEHDGQPMPAAVSVAIIADALKGLHAAHEATDELGRLLGVVHRDVSPQNILVGVDGVARLADFGIAKVMRSAERTQTGIVKGKLAYMPPEQLRGLPLTRQADVFSLGAVLAESLSGISPKPTDEQPTKWLSAAIASIQDAALLDVVRVATKPDPRDRFATASEMGAALAAAMVPAGVEAVTDRVTVLAGDEIDQRSELVRRVEAASLDDVPPTTSGEVAAVQSGDPRPSARPPARPSAPPARKKQASSPRPIVLFLSGALIAAAGVVAYARLAQPSSRHDANESSEFPPPPVLATENVPNNAPAPSAAASVGERRPVSPPPAATKNPPRARTRTTQKTPHPGCDPPFRIDSEGKKHYRPECLE